MITCPVCKHRELEGELYCSACAARLLPQWDDAQPTMAFTMAFTGSMPLGGPRPGTTPLPSTPAATTGLVLNIEGQASVSVPAKPEVLLGREGHAQLVPDVNLSPYGAASKGVSRAHAALRQEHGGWVVVDLGSTNGTFLNGTRLAPRQPQPVASGDELRLAQLAIRITINP